LLPCSYPPCPGDASPATLSPPVSPTPTFERSRLDPPRTIGSLSTRPKPRFPVALGHRQRSHLLCQLHLLRSLDPSLSPFALTRASPSRVAVALLVLCPSRDNYPPSLGTSNPPEPSQARALPGPRRNQLATPGTCPRRRVKAPQRAEAHWTTFVGSTRPSSGPDRTASRRRPYSLDLLALTVSRLRWPAELLST